MNNKSVILEFVRSLADDDLTFLVIRLSDRLQDDLFDALEIMGRHKALDSLLSSAKTGDEFLDICDQVADTSQREYTKKVLNKIQS